MMGGWGKENENSYFQFAFKFIINHQDLSGCIFEGDISTMSQSNSRAIRVQQGGRTSLSKNMYKYDKQLTMNHIVRRGKKD